MYALEMSRVEPKRKLPCGVGSFEQLCTICQCLKRTRSSAKWLAKMSQVVQSLSNEAAFVAVSEVRRSTGSKRDNCRNATKREL
jgi:hypothetical protein